MGIPEWIAIISVVIALASLAIQQHLTRQQNKAEARARHNERTQTLILKALDDPELLEAISGGFEKDQKQRRFRQVWLNHVEMIFRQRKSFEASHWKGTLHDIRGFLNMPAMQQHWKIHEEFYADDFRTFMNDEIIEKAEPPKTETPPEIAPSQQA